MSGSCGRFPRSLPGWKTARRHLFLLRYLPSHQLSSSALPLSGAWGLLRCPGAPLGCTPGGPIPLPLLTGLPRPDRTSPRERNRGTQGTGEGGAQQHPGMLPPPCPADTSPCAHLAGDVTWRLGRGENLLPAPVQRRGLSLRDVHSHRGHRFPGETTTAASPSPPLTRTLARTGCWEGVMGVSSLCTPNNLPTSCRCLLKPFHLSLGEQ